MLMFFLLSLGTVALAQQDTTHMPSNAPLQNTRWKLIKLPGFDSLPQLRKDAWIQFEHNSNRFRGNAGCNNMSGTFQTADKNGITIGPAAMTRMACPEAMMKVEQSVTTAIQDATNYQINGDRLTLLKNNTVLAVFEALYLR